MDLVSFNAFRILDIPSARYFKPELFYSHLPEVEAADWVLFPEYWQVNALVYGLKKRIFPSPASYHLGHDKIEMTRGFWSMCPEHVPYTEILASTGANVEQVLETFDFPFVAKEARSSMGQGVFLIENARAFRDYAVRNPVLYVQEYLPIDRDLRIVLVGDEVVAGYWRVAGKAGFHNNLSRGGTAVFEAVPAEAGALVQRVAAHLGIDHAGFDVAEVGGRYYLLEFNVFFGNQGLGGIRLGKRVLAYLHRHGDSPAGPGRIPPVAA